MDDIPSWNAPVNYQANLTKDVSNVAPLASSWHGAQTGVPIQQIVSQPTQTQGNVSKFFHFIGGVASEVGHMYLSANKWLAQNEFNMVAAPIRAGAGISHGLLDHSDNSSVTANSQQLTDQLTTVTSDFKAGRITPDQYKIATHDIGQQLRNVDRQSTSLTNRVGADQKATIQASVNTASTLVTILTAGFGKAASTAITAGGVAPVAEKTAAEYLTSTNANAFLSNVESGITKVAADQAAFAKLSPMAQKAIQETTAEVVGASQTMTAAQIARASAVNLALKYPIYFNALSSTGQQLYSQLDNKKYGAAVQTLAFNAALLLSGGPIGQALKFGGKVGIVARDAVFGRSSFLDELSKGIGDGSSNGLYKAINSIEDPALRKEVITNMSHVEATNLGAVNGRDPVAAAWRVLNGMASYEGASMDHFTHEEALTNMVKFAKNQQLADDVSKRLGLGPITVGRVDARSLNNIASEITTGDSVESRLQLWESLKASSPSQAWANSETLDKQIKSIIQNHPDGSGILEEIAGIKASFGIKGFPSAEARQLAKDGYIAIQPAKIEAPFKEGTGELSSKFTNGDDFFTKAVQPLPVASGFGKMLTIAGLSPQASTERVYQVFNKNLTSSLASTDLAPRFLKTKVAGDPEQTLEQAADTMIKRLSNYAKEPTRGGLQVGGANIRPPITDLRQLTTKDVQTALDISGSEARQVKGAIQNAFLQVPLTIRGLGDRVMDLNYKLPLTARYARIQGAVRFAWNPIFAAKLDYKTEILSQAQSGGQFPTLLGTNKILGMIFPDKYAQLDDVVSQLRTGGYLNAKTARHEVMSGEAVVDSNPVGANLTHPLLPGQERSIAGLISTQADKAGMSVENFLKTFPDQTRDTIQAIAQYDRRSSFLQSPLARTLNYAFFPFRFEYKVASIMAKSLAQTSVMTQFAVIKGLYNGSNFLKSPEGQAWYSQNADVIGLMKYFTPLSTLSTVSGLLGGHTDQIGAYGELGGLPFGWITQLLDSEGLTHFGTSAYVDAKTGQELPKYIPATDKGKLATAIQDLIGSLFTYPGATAGLPSKSSITRNIAMDITGAATKTDYTKSLPPLDASQQSYQKTIQAQQGTTPQPPPENVPYNQPIAVPTQPSPLTVPKSKTGSGSSTKKKKADFAPALLPGQTQAGVI